jgi:predicted metal-binding membrane protein
MSLLWVAGLGTVVLVEKLMAGPWIGRIGGLLLAAWGVWLLVKG